MAFGSKLAELFVEIKAKDEGLNAHLDKTKASLTTWTIAMGTAAGTLAGKAIASAAGGIAGFFADGVRGAIELNGALARVDATFGQAGGSIKAMASEMAKFGVAKAASIDAATAFAQTFKNAGMATDAAVEMGNKITKLGLDMAAFRGSKPEEVFGALSAAFRGEFDPLERFGPQLKADVINKAAGGADADALSVKLETFNQILRDTVVQQGALERNAGSTAATWQKLTGTISNMSIELVGNLEPALNAVLKLGVNFVEVVRPGVEMVGRAFKTFSDSVVEAIAVMKAGWNNLGILFEITKIQAGVMFDDTLAVLKTLPENVVKIASYIGRNWHQIITDYLSATSTAFLNFGGNLKSLAEGIVEFLKNPASGFSFTWTPLLDGFKSTVEKFPDLIKPAFVDVSERVKELTSQMVVDSGKAGSAAVTKAQEEIKKVSKLTPVEPQAALAQAVAAKADQFRSEQFNAADFSMRLRSSILSGKDQTAEKQLEATKDVAINTREIRDVLKGGIPAVLA